MAQPITFSFENDPATLTDNVGTQLYGVLDTSSTLAPHLERHARATRPAVPGVLHVEFRFILLLLGAVARVDGAQGTGALAPMRGLWTEAWISQALS